MAARNPESQRAAKLASRDVRKKHPAPKCTSGGSGPIGACQLHRTGRRKRGRAPPHVRLPFVSASPSVWRSLLRALVRLILAQYPRIPVCVAVILVLYPLYTVVIPRRSSLLSRRLVRLHCCPSFSFALATAVAASAAVSSAGVCQSGLGSK